MRKLLLLLVLFPLSALAQQINPATQINWPLVTGTAAPTASCTSTNYGQPYLDLSTFAQYLCVSGGWSQISTLFQHNGTNLADQNLLNFNDTTPAAPSGTQNIIFQTDANGDLSAYYPPDGTISGPLNVKVLNGIVSACAFAGSTADAQIDAAVAALPGGGTVDARCFGDSTQTFASAVTLGDGVHSWTLECDPQTQFEPGTPTMTMLELKSGSHLRGCTFNTTNQTAYSGSVIEIGSTSHASDSGPVRSGPDAYNLIPSTSLSHVLINMGASGTGTGLLLQASSQYDSFVQWVHVSNLNISTPGTCMGFQTTGTGWINSNLFNNIACVNTAANAVGISADPNGGVIESNQFSNYSYEGDDLSGVTGIKCLAGSSYFNGNQFAAMSLWDTENGTAIDMSASAKCQNNSFVGTLNGGSILQNSGSETNVLMDSRSSVFSLPAGFSSSAIFTEVGVNGGVSGQGGFIARNGSSGGVILAPYGNITGAAAASALTDGSTVPILIVTGSGAVVDAGPTSIGTSSNPQSLSIYSNPSNAAGITLVPSSQSGNVVSVDNPAQNAVVSDLDSSGGATFTAPVTIEGVSFVPIANISITVPASAIAANTCTATTTVAMTGVTTASTFQFTPTTDVSSVTGWSPASTGQLYFAAWPTAGDLNYKVCNPTAASITPGASTTWNVSAK